MYIHTVLIMFIYRTLVSKSIYRYLTSVHASSKKTRKFGKSYRYVQSWKGASACKSIEKIVTKVQLPGSYVLYCSSPNSGNMSLAFVINSVRDRHHGTSTFLEFLRVVIPGSQYFMSVPVRIHRALSCRRHSEGARSRRLDRHLVSAHSKRSRLELYRDSWMRKMCTRSNLLLKSQKLCPPN